MKNKECSCLKQFVEKYIEKAQEAKSPAEWSAYMTVVKEMEQFLEDMKRQKDNDTKRC